MTILALIHPPTRGMLRARHHWVSVTVACLLKRGYNRGMGRCAALPWKRLPTVGGWAPARSALHSFRNMIGLVPVDLK